LKDYVVETKGDLQINSVAYEQLKSQYEGLYSSFHVSISVDALHLKQAVELFMAAASWPVQIYVPGTARQNTMANHNSHLNVSTYNCRSLKSSVIVTKDLCNIPDFVSIQEHWLLSNERAVLKSIHCKFLSTGTSAVDMSKNILVERPCAGIAIQFRRDSNNYRTSAVKFVPVIGSILMPRDYVDMKSVENYTDT
jgi:hypothetical protein